MDASEARRARDSRRGEAMALAITITTLVVLGTAWVGWRRYSRHGSAPFPASLAWLVEIDNPLAKFTRAQHIVERLAPAPGERILDIGCGPGRVTIPLARAVGPDGEVVALDVQAGMLARLADKAQRAGVTNIRALEADFRQAPQDDGSADAAVSAMALGEIPDPDRTLARAFALLRPGGRLLVVESTFDPHYVPIHRLRDLAAATGFIDRGCRGNLFGYSLLLETPSAAPARPDPAATSV